MIQITNEEALSAKIALAAILDAWACEESLSHEMISEVLDDAKSAYSVLCYRLGVTNDYK